jgi:hypothetical protein
MYFILFLIVHIIITYVLFNLICKQKTIVENECAVTPHIFIWWGRPVVGVHAYEYFISFINCYSIIHCTDV